MSSRARTIVAICVASFAVYLAFGCALDLHVTELSGSLPDPACPPDARPVIYDNLQFGCSNVVRIYRLNLLHGRWFPWARDFTQWASIGLLATSLGLVGGFVRSIYAWYKNPSRASWRRVYVGPVGSVLSVAAGQVAATTVGGEGLPSVSLVVIAAILGGFFVEDAVAAGRTAFQLVTNGSR